MTFLNIRPCEMNSKKFQSMQLSFHYISLKFLAYNKTWNGVEWSGKIWTGVIKPGVIKHGMTKYGVIKRVGTKHGVIK